MASKRLAEVLKKIKRMPLPTREQNENFSHLPQKDPRVRLWMVLTDIDHPWHSEGEVKVPRMSQETARRLLRSWRSIKANATRRCRALPDDDPRKILASAKTSHPLTWTVTVMEMTVEGAAAFK
ncbi:MAG: hypothetical protein WC480_03615 [Patescibacteria group bacterium]